MTDVLKRNREATPPPDEIHVWRVGLPTVERRATARRALRKILAGYLGEDPRAIALGADANGKPELAAAPPRLSFNLSHSDGLALVAVAPGGVEVGVDVELIKPRRNLARLAARWLPPADAAAVGAASGTERELVFYAAWTRHEARVKCSGAGLAGPPPGADVVARQLAIDAGYAAAVAVSGGREPRILLRDASCRR